MVSLLGFLATNIVNIHYCINKYIYIYSHNHLAKYYFVCK
jgi:hypothetical protein